MPLDPINSSQGDYSSDNAVQPSYHLNLKSRKVFADPCINGNNIELDKVASGQDIRLLEQAYIAADAQAAQVNQQAVGSLTTLINNVAAKRTNSYTVAAYAESIDALATVAMPTFPAGAVPYYANRVLINDPNPANYGLNGIYNKLTLELELPLAADFPEGTDVMVAQTNRAYRVLQEPGVDTDGTINSIYFDPWNPFESRNGVGAIHTEDAQTIALQTEPELTQIGRSLGFSAETKAELAGMHSEINAAQQDITTQGQRLTTTENTVVSQGSTLQAQAQDIILLKQYDQSVTSDLTALQQYDQSVGQQIQTINGALDTHSQQIGSAQASINQVTGQVTILQQKDGALDAKDVDLQSQIDLINQSDATKITENQATSLIQENNAIIFQEIAANFQEIKLTDTDISVQRNFVNGTTIWRYTAPSADFRVTGYYDLPVEPSARREEKQLSGRFIEGNILEVRETGDIPNGIRTLCIANFTPNF